MQSEILWFFDQLKVNTRIGPCSLSRIFILIAALDSLHFRLTPLALDAGFCVECAAMLQVNMCLRNLSLSGRQTLDTVSQQMMGLGSTVSPRELSVRDLSLITDSLRTNRVLQVLVRNILGHRCTLPVHDECIRCTYIFSAANVLGARWSRAWP